MNYYTAYPLETRQALERIAYRIAFIILHGDSRLIGLYLAHVRSLPHGPMVDAILDLIGDMSHE